MQAHHAPQQRESFRSYEASRKRRSKAAVPLAVMQALENRLLLDGAPPTPTGLAHTTPPACQNPFDCSSSSTLSWSGTYAAGDTAHLEVSTDGLNWVETQTGDATAHQLVVNYLNLYPEFGPTYRFRVRVSNTSGSSSYSNVDTLAQNVHPIKPYGVYAEKTGVSGQIHLHWDGDYTTSNPYDQIHIEESTDDVSFHELTSSSTIASTHDQWINNLSTSQTHYFRLSASNSSGTSPYSEVVSADITGTGITDNAPGLQSLINKAGNGDTVQFDTGATYTLYRGLVINKSVNILGNQATLIMNNGDSSVNKMVHYRSVLGPTTWSWNEAISNGQTTFNVHIPTSQLQAGDLVFVQLGQDPEDPNEENFSMITSVYSNDGTTLTLNDGSRYDIINQPAAGAHRTPWENLATDWHHITKITSLVQGFSIADLNFNYTTPNAVPDEAIWLDTIQNATVQHIGGRFTTAILASDSDSVTIDGLNGQVADLFSSAGRVLGVWQSDDVRIFNVNVTTNEDSAVFFLESYARNTWIENVYIDWKYPYWGSSDVFHLTGHSTGTEIRNVTIHNVGPVNVVDSGGQAGDEYHFTRLDVSGEITHLPLELVDELHNGDRIYGPSDLTEPANLLTFNHDDPLIQSQADYPLVSGVIKSITMTIPTGLNSVILQSSGPGGVHSMVLCDNDPLTVYPVCDSLAQIPTSLYPGWFGTHFGLNDLDFPDKRLHVEFGQGFDNGTISSTVQYWKPSLATPEHFTATPVDSDNRSHITWEGIYNTNPQDQILLDWSTDGINWTNHATTIASSLSTYITGLSQSQTYYIRAQVFNSGQTISSAYTDALTLDPAEPEVPFDVRATPVTTSGATTVTWRGGFLVGDQVVIERSEDNQNFSPVATVTATNGTKPLTGFDLKKLYYLRMRTIRSGSPDSDYSQTFVLASQAIPPMRVQRLVASGLDAQNQTQVRWDGVFKADAYPDGSYDLIDLQYSTDPNFGTYTPVTNIHAALQQYNLTLPSSSITYYIRAIPHNSFRAAWNYSPTATVFSTTGRPATPTGVTATTVDSVTRRVSWDPVPTGDTVHVEISLDGFTFWEYAETSGSNSSIDLPVSYYVTHYDNPTFYFRIRVADVTDPVPPDHYSNYSLIALAT